MQPAPSSNTSVQEWPAAANLICRSGPSFYCSLGRLGEHLGQETPAAEEFRDASVAEHDDIRGVRMGAGERSYLVRDRRIDVLRNVHGGVQARQPAVRLLGVLVEVSTQHVGHFALAEVQVMTNGGHLRCLRDCQTFLQCGCV